MCGAKPATFVKQKGLGSEPPGSWGTSTRPYAQAPKLYKTEKLPVSVVETTLTDAP